jgi:hypothetical protein
VSLNKSRGRDGAPPIRCTPFEPDHRATRLIRMHARLSGELRTLAAGCGADGYLQKTSDAPALRKAVQRLLRA